MNVAECVAKWRGLRLTPTVRLRPAERACSRAVIAIRNPYRRERAAADDRSPVAFQARSGADVRTASGSARLNPIALRQRTRRQEGTHRQLRGAARGERRRQRAAGAVLFTDGSVARPRSPTSALPRMIRLPEPSHRAFLWHADGT